MIITRGVLWQLVRTHVTICLHCIWCSQRHCHIPKIWNSFPPTVCICNCPDTFCHHLETHYRYFKHQAISTSAPQIQPYSTVAQFINLLPCLQCGYSVCLSPLNINKQIVYCCVRRYVPLWWHSDDDVDDSDQARFYVGAGDGGKLLPNLGL